MRHFIAGAICLIALAACNPSGETRMQTAQRIAIGSGFSAISFNQSPYSIQGWQRGLGSNNILRIYIEGDGFAWRTPQRPSKDPTPITPTALQLATKDNYGAVLYLARPCHYYTASYCKSDLWTDARYSERTLQSYQALLNGLKARFHVQQFELVGFSGGGVIAALLAGTRDDVLSLRSVSSPLDTDAWTRSKNFRPLKGSLNPTFYADVLASIPQKHFLGARDEVVPQSTLASYQARLGVAQKCSETHIIQSNSHRGGWVNDWFTLLEKTPACASPTSGVAK